MNGQCVTPFSGGHERSQCDDITWPNMCLRRKLVDPQFALKFYMVDSCCSHLREFFYANRGEAY